MDPLTHAVTGAMIAQLGFRQKIGREAAWVAAAVAAFADVDLFFAHGGVMSLGVHRGMTHSLAAVPVIALAAALIWRAVRARWWEPRPFWLMFLCTLLAAATHPALDLMTSYGTMLLWPFSRQRFALDAVEVVDVVFSSNVALTVAACYLVGKLWSKRKGVRFAVAWAGLTTSVAYLVMGVMLHGAVIRYAQRSLETASELVRLSPDAVAGGQGPAPGTASQVEYRAYPQIGSIFHWRVTRRTPTRWLVTSVNVLRPKRVEWREVRRNEDSWVQRAELTPEAQAFKWFAMGQVRTYSKVVDGKRVAVFADMRYGQTTDSVDTLWWLEVTFGDDGQPAEARLGEAPVDLGQFVKELWLDTL